MWYNDVSNLVLNLCAESDYKVTSFDSRQSKEFSTSKLVLIYMSVMDKLHTIIPLFYLMI